MSKRQVNKQFIEEKLIPFILRDQGRGFVMYWWDMRLRGKSFFHPDLERTVQPPSCGTVFCIGGSVASLAPRVPPFEILGLTRIQATRLFYHWKPGSHGWPNKFARAFTRATTPLSKARVAVRLLREVIRTNGECLGN